ncbi:hypothetical protein ACX27_10735 [Nostoc piscinale CENA21]|uniref:Uncharacterized protein n=1 Tax=Nostoc piscinale CENA21 TaxID=224013 RepID=A0A0M4TVT4_9NOSO|nr:hypothetical protein ACX27_10735 [Nostoc piscinale CENA21]
MDWLYKLSIYISRNWGYNPNTTELKVIDAEVTAFIKSVGSRFSPYIPIHSFVVIRSQQLTWQK